MVTATQVEDTTSEPKAIIEVKSAEVVKSEPIEDSLSYPHFLRVMRQEGVEARWRADYGGSQWMTLYSKDVKLLILCGFGTPTGYYETPEIIYKPEQQPLVALSEKDNIYSLYSVYYGNRYVTHEEGEKLVTQNTTQPALQEKGITIEQIDAQIEKAFQARLEEHKKHRPTDSAVFSPEDESREKAQALLDVSAHVDGQQDKLGKIQMKTLWRLRQSGDFRALAGNPESITDIVRNQQYKNRDYVLSLSMVVDRVFPQVEALEKSGVPFTNPLTGAAITVDDLIVSEGLIGKLTKSSALFVSLIDIDKRRLLMGAIVTKTREEVAALREELSKVKIQNGSGEATDGADKKDLISCLIEAIPSSQPGMPGKHRLIFDDLDDAQMRAILAITRPLTGDLKQ